MEKDKLKKYCDDGLSSYMISKKENVSQTTIRYWLKKFELKTKSIFKYDKGILMNVVKESKTYNEVLRKLNKSNSSNGYISLKKAIKLFNINTTHFHTKKEVIYDLFENGKIKKYENNEIFNINNVARATVKKRIIVENLIPYLCCQCGQDENWRGIKISLILDHINGINNDNRLENLRFLCPNCNVGLPTHCKGKNGLVNAENKRKKTRKIADRSHTRKTERPPYNQLKKEIEETNYSAVGRKYGVSDNAIRKWLKFYEKQK